MRKDHLAKAREYIGRGEEFYRKAAEEIAAARLEGYTWPAIASGVGRSQSWCKELVAKSKIGQYSAPFSGEYSEVKARLTKSSLKSAAPEELAEMMSDPKVRANVARASAIADKRVEERSYEKQRQAVGTRASAQLEAHARYQDAEAELFKARRALIEALRILNTVGIEELDDAWCDELRRTLSDISAKAKMGRAFLAGSSLDDELAELLGA